MAIGDLVEYQARIGLSGSPTTRTGIDIGSGRIATSTSAGGRTRTTEQPRPAGSRTIARAGTPRALAAASNPLSRPGVGASP